MITILQIEGGQIKRSPLLTCSNPDRAGMIAQQPALGRP